MPTPIGHGLMGAAVLAAFPLRRDKPLDWRVWLLGAALGITPDLDCLLGYLPFAPFAGRGWHHDFTHSLGFACLCGGLLALCWRAGANPLRAALVFSAAMATHPLLDYLLTDSRGVELFWPFAHEYVRLGLTSPSAFTWQPGGRLGRVVYLVQAGILDLVMFGPVLALSFWLRQRALRQGEGWFWESGLYDEK